MAIVLNQIRGLSDSKWSGIEGACYKLIGLDVQSTPGITKVRQRLAKESGDTVDEFVKVACAVSTGESFWFSADSGKIWRRSSTGMWLLVFTTTAAAGEVKCLGAREYDGYLYWATQSRLHRISTATAHATAQNWTDNAALNWATFAVTDDTWHPMAVQDLTLWIGDGNQVASVDDAGTFDNNALDLLDPLRISAMIDYENDILMGMTVADNVNKAQVIRWDCVSTSWNTSDPVEGSGVSAFIRDDNYVYAYVGTAGALYFYNGEQLETFKIIPGDYSGKTAKIHAGSVSNYNNVPIFGYSNVSGNPSDFGIYAFGSYSRDYNKVLDLSWPMSPGVTTGIEIGAILVLGTTIVAAWKNGTGESATYGVDASDASNKYASAYLETMMLFQESRGVNKTLGAVEAFYASLPTNTGFVFSYSINGAAYVAMTSVTDTTIARQFAELSVGDVGSLQIKVSFTTSNNDGPEMEALGVIIDGV